MVLNISNSVKRFLTSKHASNRIVIEIWHYKWFINDHTTFVVKNFFETLENIQLSPSLYAHIRDMFCKIQFAINLYTENFHSFHGNYDCIVIIYHHTLNIITMGWNQHCMEINRIILQRIFLNQFIKITMSFVKNFWILSIVSPEWIRNAIIIDIVVDVTLTIKKLYIIYEYMKQ